MKPIRMTALLLSAALLFSLLGCSAPSEKQDDMLHITVTTYPLYVLTAALCAGAEGVDLRRLETGSVSCLHDYTLTVSDMRHLEQADILVLNGAGLEGFLDQALGSVSGLQVDCSRSVHLLAGEGHSHGEECHNHDHDHDHEHDAHYWMDPHNLAHAAQQIAQALAETDPEQESLYLNNAETVHHMLEEAGASWKEALSGVSCPYLITFHNGFHYLADAFGLEILFSIEEEEGATASAKDILTASELVKEYSLPAVFTEVNGSGAAAKAVSGETGVPVAQLSMLMSGEDVPADLNAADILSRYYLTPMGENIQTLSEVLK